MQQAISDDRKRFDAEIFDRMIRRLPPSGGCGAAAEDVLRALPKEFVAGLSENEFGAGEGVQAAARGHMIICTAR